MITIIEPDRHDSGRFRERDGMEDAEKEQQAKPMLEPLLDQGESLLAFTSVEFRR